MRPRGHRGGIYPFMRGAMCVVVRDLIVYGVLTDMMRGRPAIYATFSSYDEVAHHSGLERADTLEALRKLDQQFGRIDARPPLRAAAVRDRRPLGPRPDAGRDVQAAQRLRARRARRALAATRQRSPSVAGGDEQQAMVGHAVGEATGAQGEAKREERRLRRGRRRARLGQPRARLPDGGAAPADARGDRRAAPELIPALRAHPHVGWLLVRSSEHGARRARRRAARTTSPTAGSRARIRSRASRPTRRSHLLRTDGFAHVADIMVGSFYDPELDEGCAFEELISFHGGIGGPQTRPFILHPVELPLPEEPLVGAAAVHGLLLRWRQQLQGA